MARTTAESDDAHLRRCGARWTYFKRVVAGLAERPGEARAIIKVVYEDPAWRAWSAVRWARFHRTDGYKEWRKRYEAERRASPEYKEWRRDYDRRRYLASKEA